jgi:predicted ATP-grasp superfamily ATP-dependent carboligase
MRVLVTDGENRAALAVTRSLGRAGHHVIVADRRANPLAAASRFSSSATLYPDPATDEAGFVDAVAQIVSAQSIDMLLPVADITTLAIAEHRHRFPPACLIPIPAAGVVAQAADKAHVLRTAEALGVPVPKTIYVGAAHLARDVLDGLVFPIVVKPCRSRARTPTGWVSSSVTYAGDAQSLLSRLQALPAEVFPVLLQERIAGDGLGVFMCCRNGEVLAEFSHKRLREKPPSGGVSVLCESIAMQPELRRSARMLLEALEWQGVAMVEFKSDPRDNVAKLMEINGRFWGSLQLAIDAGVDFPLILLESMTTGVAAPMPAYRSGVRSRWLWGDFDALLLQLFSTAVKDHPIRARVRAVAEFMMLWQRDLHYENPRASDLRPWVRETTHWFQRLAPSRGRA